MSDFVSPAQQVQNGHVAHFLKQYWFLITFLFIAGFAWSELRGDVRWNMSVNETQNAQIEDALIELRVLDKQYIEDITFIKTTLQELKGKPENNLQSRIDSIERQFSNP